MLGWVHGGQPTVILRVSAPVFVRMLGYALVRQPTVILQMSFLDKKRKSVTTVFFCGPDVFGLDKSHNHFSVNLFYLRNGLN